MSSIEKLVQLGRELGYEGEELKQFVKEEQIMERENRKIERDMKNAELQAEKERRDAELQAQKENREMEMMMVRG